MADQHRLADNRKRTRHGAIEQIPEELRFLQRVRLAEDLNANARAERNQVEPHGSHRLQQRGADGLAAHTKRNGIRHRLARLRRKASMAVKPTWSPPRL